MARSPRALDDVARRTPERMLEEMRAILAISTRINAGVTLDEVLNHVFDEFQVLIPYDRLGCSLIQGERVEAIFARSRLDRVLLGRHYTARLAGSSLEQVVESGRPRILNDLAQYLGDHPSSDSTRLIVAEGLRSSLTCPLVSDGRPVGFLFFAHRAPGTYTRAHVDVFREVAGQVSLALEKSRLIDDLVATKRRLVQANAALARVAYLDSLTGVPSRRSFDLHLEREWKRAARSSEPLSIAALDVDHFKAFNDALGHPAGDECLRAVAGALLAGVKRGGDLVARVGGEEFAALLPRTDAAAAALVAERLRSEVEALALAHPGSSAGPRVTVSVGVATLVPHPGSAPAELLRAADAALYRAKAAGRNRVMAGE